MASSVSISERHINISEPPYIIAEMSGNHNQSLDRALAIVDAAAEAGVDAVKIQTYTPDTMTLNLSSREFVINDSNSLWQGRTMYQVFQDAHTPWEWHKSIIQRCQSKGITCFSSPFDTSAVDFLEELEMPAYKIASFEINDIPLIKRVARTRKPMIMSVGMATIGEIDEAVMTAKENGCTSLVLLKCTSTYPATARESNVITIPHLRNTFNCEVGLSDHTLGIGAAIAAVSHGASVIEKHFTLARSDGGTDAEFSLEPSELALLVKESRQAWDSLGKVAYGPTESEKASTKYRRSIYVSDNMSKGDKFTTENTRIIRPGLGLHPRYYEIILGAKAKTSINAGTPISWDMLDRE